MTFRSVGIGNLTFSRLPACWSIERIVRLATSPQPDACTGPGRPAATRRRHRRPPLRSNRRLRNASKSPKEAL